MGFDVGLIDDVHPQFVTQVVEGGIVGIVRGADGGDVVATHDHQVVAHVLDGDRLAAVRVVVMAVDAEDPDGPSVHQQLSVTDLDMAEANQLRRRIGDRAIRCDQFNTHPISGRRLRTPRCHPGQLARRVHHMAGEHVRIVEPVRHRRDLRLAHPAPAGGLDR